MTPASYKTHQKYVCVKSEIYHCNDDDFLPFDPPKQYSNKHTVGLIKTKNTSKKSVKKECLITVTVT